jgi:EAL domain-containing protein (putative c-di-GMP-specific phosphodiesterase class I)/CheY-like chemotaxis protein
MCKNPGVTEPKAKGTAAAGGGKILLVDDDPGVLFTYVRVLGAAGFEVFEAANGAEAVALLANRAFDAVVSDISMPELNGMSLLRLIRESRDEDVPVLLMTGTPAIETAAQAVEFGAYRYLIKPIDASVMVQAVQRAVGMRRLAESRRRALELLGPQIEEAVEHAGLHEAFGRAFQTVRMAFQPVVRWSDRTIVAYEGLVRNDEPTLVRPDQFIGTAERLGRLADLGRAIRRAFAEFARRAPDNVDLYINLHPSDLGDEDLFDAAQPLSAIAARVVLEITERASLTPIPDLRAKVRRLRAMGFRIALDDLGAGYSGLTSFTLLEPDVVKLDMALVRGVDSDATKGMLVASIIGLCRSLGMEVIAEGVESASERDVLVGMGCDLLQGFLFARPVGAFGAASY